MTSQPERPILMDALSIKGILDGSKTQTRRPVKPQPPPRSQWHQESGLFRLEGSRLGVMKWCPFGISSDHLWVRETWAPLPQNYRRAKCQSQPRMYRADGEIVYWPAQHYPDYQDKPFETWQRKEEYEGKPIKWRPSIHMPRWACRITLRVKRVWAEQVQEISPNEIAAEGCPEFEAAFPSFMYNRLQFQWFRARWDSIYRSDHGWDVNPWVWACEFERIES